MLLSDSQEQALRERLSLISEASRTIAEFMPRSAGVLRRLSDEAVAILDGDHASDS